MKSTPLNKIIAGFILLIVILMASACNEDPVLWQVESEDQVISDYIASRPSEFSEIQKILDETKLYRVLSTRGPYTFFLPTDEAMRLFYEENNVTSFLDFSDPKAGYKLLFNHLVANEISSSDIGLGAIRDTNAIGDYLVTEFSGADIIVNKQAKIIDRDIRTANGYIHVIDHVIDPVVKSVYEVLEDNPDLSLFTQGLEATGLKDTLSVISFPFGNLEARTRFTVLAVADTTFNRYGIKNINELIAYYTDRPDSITYLENDFYRFMEYHCLSGTHYLSDFEDGLYPILSADNNVLITVDNDYKLNLDLATEMYTGFNVLESNYPAKNGAIHVVNDLLPVEEPDPTLITFEVTDYLDLKQGDYFGKYYRKWSDGQNTFQYIKWGGDYLQYYFKDHDTGPLLNDDCLNMLGYWWIEITTPKIMRGKYKLSGNIWQNYAGYEVYVDGEQIGLVKSSEVPNLGTFNWTKTERHTIKLVAVEFGALFWDTVTFTPVD